MHAKTWIHQTHQHLEDGEMGMWTAWVGNETNDNIKKRNGHGEQHDNEDERLNRCKLDKLRADLNNKGDIYAALYTEGW